MNYSRTYHQLYVTLTTPMPLANFVPTWIDAARGRFMTSVRRCRNDFELQRELLTAMAPRLCHGCRPKTTCPRCESCHPWPSFRPSSTCLR